MSTAYRGLANPIEDTDNLDALLDQSKLNWEVCEYPVEYSGRNGKKTMPSRKVLVRCDTDDEIEVVSASFKVHQNREIVGGLASIAKASGVKLDAGGSLDGGAKIFLTGSVDKQFDASGEKKLGDIVQLRYIVSGGHKPGTPTTIKAEGQRLVCFNGATVGAGAFAVRFTHQSKLQAADLRKLQNFVEATTEGFTQYEAKAVKLMGTTISREVNEAFVLELLHDNLLENIVNEATHRNGMTGKDILAAIIDRAENNLLRPMQLAANSGQSTRTAQQVLHVMNSQPGADMARGTMWNAYNAVTYHVDHVRGATASTAVDSAIFGEGDRLKRSALDLAVEYTERLQAIRGRA